MGKYTTYIALGLLIGLIVYTAYQGTQQPQQELAGVGGPAPSFSIPDLDGEAWSGPQDYPGKVVVLDFWSSYCPACRRTMPMFQTLYEHFSPDDVVLLSINVNPDERGAPLQAVVSRFRDDFQLGFPLWIDTGQASRAYGVDSIPYVVIIDREGVVRHIHIADVPERRLFEEIEELVGEPLGS